MRSLLLLASIFSISLNASSQTTYFKGKALVPSGPAIALPGADVHNQVKSATRATCNDKILYLDNMMTPSPVSYDQVGGNLSASFSGQPLNAFFQVYPDYTGQVTRVDFLGGKFSANETVEVWVLDLNTSGAPAGILGYANATVNTVNGEFGAALPSPVNVSGGFAVAVHVTNSLTDSIKVLDNQVTYMGLSWIQDNTYKYKLSDSGLDLDFYIRPTISFNIGAPVLNVTPATTCTGNNVTFSGTAPTGVAHLNDPMYNPGGWLNPSLDYGDGSSLATSLPANHAYATAGSKTASLTWIYDGYNTDCPSSPVTQTVTVNPEPTSAFAWSATGLAVTFTNLSTGATTYSWAFGDAGTASAPNPVHNYAASGTYTVELTATNSCGSDISFTNITITDSTNGGNIGVIEFNEEITANIYPNPSSSWLNVDLSLKHTTDVSVQIVNNMGQVVYNRAYGKGDVFSMNLNTTSLVEGIYYLRIQYGESLLNRPFVKQ